MKSKTVMNPHPEGHADNCDCAWCKPQPTAKQSRTEGAGMHTPLPWRVYDENPLEGEVYIKSDGRENGSLVAKIVDPGDEDGMEIARDTAAFIVRAVNSHEELVQALDNCLNYIGNRLEMDDETFGKYEGLVRKARAEGKE